MERTDSEMLILRNRIKELEKNDGFEEHQSVDKLNTSIMKENRNLQAKVNQLIKVAQSNVTPKKIRTPKHSERHSKEFEVDCLLKHRGRKGNREYLIRWKHFTSEYDTWEKENNLKCPKILKQYKKTYDLA